jgi:hypothetical protein
MGRDGWHRGSGLPVGWLVAGVALLVACGGPKVETGWVDASGRPAGNVIEETPGAPCAPSATFLRYRNRVFVRAPRGEIPPLEGAPPYDGSARLPRDAIYTGYHEGPRQLWISPSDRGLAIYIVVGDRVERWPAAGAACA